MIMYFEYCRKLSAENRKLYIDVEKEAQDKKRLSMENDELHWKIRQGLDQGFGGNCSGLMSMSVIEGKPVGKLSMCDHNRPVIIVIFQFVFCVQCTG